MTPRENTLRAYTFRGPERIPFRAVISHSCWYQYPQDELAALIRRHPAVFPDPDRSATPPSRDRLASHRRAGERAADSWGCVWTTSMDGITGAVVEHPLEDWAAFDTWTPPDPAYDDGWKAMNWDKTVRAAQEAREAGRLVQAGLRHGHTFLTLTYLRGYANLLFDMTDDHPRLPELIGAVERFNAEQVRRHMAYKPDIMGYAEDLGMQNGPMLSPALFRKYIKPVYQRLIAPAREQGALVHMHSDGHVMALVEDLLDCGVDVLNLQDLVNGIDEIAATLKGRVAIDLDVDRQAVTVSGSPRDVDDLIREAVEKLGSPEGGLSFVYGMYPPTPIANADAVFSALEKYATYWS